MESFLAKVKIKISGTISEDKAKHWLYYSFRENGSVFFEQSSAEVSFNHHLEKIYDGYYFVLDLKATTTYKQADLKEIAWGLAENFSKKTNRIFRDTCGSPDIRLESWITLEIKESEVDQRSNIYLLTSRMAEYDKSEGPRVGDFVVMPDGKYERFCHDWGDSIQTTEGGSFYLGNGYIEFSGGLNPSIPLSKIKNTGKTKEGDVWFFNRDEVKAHNGVHFKATFRVFKVIERTER